MKNYAIVSQMKLKGDDFNGIDAHNRRLTSPKNVHRHLTHKNITLIQSPYRNIEAFAEAKRTQIREANIANGTKNRMVRQKINKRTGESAYQSMMQELVFTYSKDALTNEQGVKYFELALEFVKEWYSDLEIISAIIHLDEATPHIHIDTSYFDQVQCRFVQQELMKTLRTDIDTIRDAWQKKIEEAEFDLIRQDGSVVGERHDGAKASVEKGVLKAEAIELKARIDKLKATLVSTRKLAYSDQFRFNKSGKSVPLSYRKILEIREREVVDLNTKIAELQGQLAKPVADTAELQELRVQNKALTTALTEKNALIAAYEEEKQKKASPSIPSVLDNKPSDNFSPGPISSIPSLL